MAKKPYLLLYDGRTKVLKGALENATDVGYQLLLNDLDTGQFKLPATDEKSSLIDAHDLVKVTDGKRGVLWMRVTGQPEDDGGEPGTLIPYEMEGVQATLLDDSFFGYQEIGGADMRTAACIEWVLARQTTARWVLGDCDFDLAFSYVMQNNNLLALLFSLATCILAPHRWEFDASSTPWRVHLRAVPDTRECAMVYGRNLETVRRSWSGRALVNRIYCAGYGEGTNLLTIAAVNGGVPYVQDDASVARYGVKAGILTDKTIEDAATLLAAGQVALATSAWPSYTYRATLADVYEQTGLDYDLMYPGRTVWLYDRRRGANFVTRVVSLTRDDIAGDPYATEVELSEAGTDLAGSVSDLASRVGITELYSQGATQVYADRYADNADFTHPAKWSVYVDDDARTVNSIKLRITLENFRAYSTAAASGGGSSQTSGAGGGNAITSESGGYSSGVKYTGGNLDADSHAGISYTEGPNQTTFSGHKHVNAHVHALTVTTPSHTHSVNVPGHSHSVDIPSHTHDITYGIYEGSAASEYTLFVDDGPIPAIEIIDGIVDIAPWMSRDDGGRVERGKYHTIELVPNGLTRVVMELYARLYIQSIGGIVL